MKGNRWIRAFLAASLAANILVAQESAPGTDQEPRFYVGVCAHFGQGKGLSELNLQQMRAAGINSLRDELSWSGTERFWGLSGARCCSGPWSCWLPRSSP